MVMNSEDVKKLLFALLFIVVVITVQVRMAICWFAQWEGWDVFCYGRHIDWVCLFSELLEIVSIH